MTGEDAAAWEKARESIARLKIYDGLELSPQLGLVPLRVDPASGLWEFWHIASGARPEVDSARDDRYAMTPDSGIVLVLLPPGTFMVGDDTGRLTTKGKFAVTLPAIFFGKYEVTQGQWKRIMGSNPAQYSAGLVFPPDWRIQSLDQPFDEVHPIELVDWYSAERFCSRLGLKLPREVEWEYACRAGTTTDYYWGDEESVLNGRENIRDLEAQYVLGEEAEYAPWFDGFPMHAPVGSFEGNGFGLFDMHGNVGEWLRDAQDPNWWVAKGHERRFSRGGSWQQLPKYWSCCAERMDHDASEVFGFVGLRAARAIDP